MLRDIERLIQNKGPLPASVIAREMTVSVSAVDGMLELLVKRGSIQKVTLGGCEGRCCSAAQSTVVYEWQGIQALPLTQIKS